MEIQEAGEIWEVTIPAFRFDLNYEADLIEEIARLHGYEYIPLRLPLNPISKQLFSEAEK